MSDPSYMKFHETFDDMLNNAAAVKGEAYTKLVMQIINQKALIKMVDIIASESAAAGEHILKHGGQPFAEMLAVILRQNIAMVAEVLQVSDEMLKEALAFADTLTEKGEDIAKQMRDEDEEDEGD